MNASAPGFTIWLTGLSGSGKTALATAVAAALRERSTAVEVLDGDEIRRLLSPDLGFTKAERDAHVHRLGYLAKLLARNGIVVLVAAISPYQKARDDVRAAHDTPFIEVFVDCPLDEVIRRDVKGLYAKALQGQIHQFTGVSDPYESPSSPDIHLMTDRQSIREAAQTILEYLERRGVLSPDLRTPVALSRTQG